MKQMVHGLVGDGWTCLDLAICCPLVEVDGSVWCSVGLYDGQESGSVTPRYNFHIIPCLF